MVLQNDAAGSGAGVVQQRGRVSGGGQPTKENVEVVAHDVIELGRKLENPYSVTNVGKALAALYPTRGEVSVPVTDYYVRFLPKDTVQFNLLSDLGVEMLDHPKGW